MRKQNLVALLVAAVALVVASVVAAANHDGDGKRVAAGQAVEESAATEAAAPEAAAPAAETSAASSSAATTGNGAPSGKHYNLNIIGTGDKSADMTGTSGHTIFVPFQGKTTIWLCESGVDDRCLDDGFYVVDRNATDSDGALFALPNPDPDGDGTTWYSVFARALGAPGGSSTTTTCFVDATTGDRVCSVISLKLERDKGRSRFDNVTKYLLYVYADVDGNGTIDRVPIFDNRFENFLWEYDNKGLRLAQLRFYECATTVPLDPNGPQSSVCG